MVSPYKKRKIERKGRVALEGNPPKNSQESRRLKSSKPLFNRKFYLDIKNHATLKKVENKLTSLGASVELFLSKDVYCVVTDRDAYLLSKRQQEAGKNSTPKGLATPSPFCSVSPAATISPGDGVISKRTRSRAEAMLEKVRQQPEKTTLDILDSAIAWGIPIHPYAKFSVWLERLSRRESKGIKGVRELRGHFLKLETGVGRPDFRQFRMWPRVSFNGEEHTAFPKPLSRHDLQRMTRKSGKAEKELTVAGGNGYCEMCRIHFDQLETHINSTQHVRYATDSSHYNQLDSLIARHDLGNIGSLRKSLRIAKSPPVDISLVKSTPMPPEGQTAPVINGHITRSKSDKVLCNGLSPVQEKRKASIKPGGCSAGEKKDYVAVKLEPDDQKLRSRQSHGKGSPPVISSHAVSKRNKLSRKRLSVEEKLIEDNKSYYKVEVLNSKLRSTEYFINQKQLEARVNDIGVNGNCAPDVIDAVNKQQHSFSENKERVKEPVVVRFKKVRKSQLAVLSDEAESFMFGDPVKKEIKNDEEASTSESYGSRDSECSSFAEDVTPKKKIRKLINQNEVPLPLFSSRKDPQLLSSPRLKSHRGSFPTIDSPEQRKDDVSEECPEMTLDSITFSFENPPRNDPWAGTFKRRKEGKDNFYYPHYHQYPRVLLPYEYPVSERIKLLSGKKGSGFGKRSDKFYKLLDEGKPRKSPRCHASTLAIMSSLVRRRPMRECTSNPDFTYEEESRSSWPETVASSSTASENRAVISGNNNSNNLPVDPSNDVYAMALIRLVRGETSTFQVSPNPCLPTNCAFFNKLAPELSIDLQPGLTVPLETIIVHQQNTGQFHKPLDMDIRYREQDSGSDCSDLFGFLDDGRTITGKRRKRKRNMTGWPLEKSKRKAIKKEDDFHSSSLPPPPLFISPPSLAIKTEPCELEPLYPEILQKCKVPIKQEPIILNGESEYLPLSEPVKRGRGRPRKYPPPLTPVTPINKSLNKAKVSKFTFSPRKSCI